MKTRNNYFKRNTLIGFAIALLSTAQLLARDIPKGNVDAIYNAGAQNRVTQAVTLETGVYVVHPLLQEGHGSAEDTHYIFLDENIDKPGEFIGIKIDTNALDQGGANSAYLFMAAPIMNGQSVAMFPFITTTAGFESTQDKISRKAPFLEISMQSSRYPYLIKGHNGLLNGHLMEMKKIDAAKVKVEWNVWPDNGIYFNAAGTSSIEINGDLLTMLVSGKVNQGYNLTPMNGDENGKIAGMSEASFDTMSRSQISVNSFNRFSLFLKSKNGTQKIIILSPSVSSGFPGRYNAEVFDSNFKVKSPDEDKSIFDIFK